MALTLAYARVGADVQGMRLRKQSAGRPASRSMKPYAQEPEDMQPFSKFTEPYYQHYVTWWNTTVRRATFPSRKDVSEVRIGFLGPLENHPDAALGKPHAERRAVWPSTRRMPRADTAASRSS